MLRALAEGALFGQVWGDGPAQVVALHGWRRTHDDFVGVLGPPSPGGALASLALDLPGFGASPPPPEPWGSGDYAALVAEVLRTSGLCAAQVAVVGHSFGGRVALQLAASRPELVRGLVLTGAPLTLATGPTSARRPSRRFRLVRGLHRVGLVGDDRLEAARRRFGSEDYSVAQGVMRAVLVRLLAERYDDALAALQCPTELVWGDDDTAAPLALARAVAARAGARSAAEVPGGGSGPPRPTARLTVCPGAGHLTPLTAPDALRAAVERVLGATS